MCWFLYMFNIHRCSACCRPSRTWITFNRFSTIFEAVVPHFYLHYTHCIFPKSLLIIWLVSMEECWSLMQSMMQMHWSTCSVILNAMATQYTCSLNGVYHPHWLVQWSHHYSHMHSSPLSLAARLHRCHANVPIILTVAGLFLDRPHMFFG